MVVRPVEKADRVAWERMREALWPSETREHDEEVARFFTGDISEPAEVLLAIEDSGRAIGLVELSIRAYAEGCITDRVAYVEGWYVEPQARMNGVGAALISAAEEWGRSQGCVELGSDAELENDASAKAHVALGFEEVGVIRCFRKRL